MNTQDRTEVIAGMRELLDFLEAHPVIPFGTITDTGMTLYPKNREGGQPIPAALAELRAIGEVLGVELTAPYGRHVHVCGPRFRGGVSFEAIVCDAEELFKQQETSRAGDPDLTPEVPAVATAQPGDSFTPAGEEVADPTGVSGSATAPEQVWMAVKRRGADFHKLDGDRTACGRSTVTGGTDGREFLTVRLGAKPCPRCYPAEVAK